MSRPKTTSTLEAVQHELRLRSKTVRTESRKLDKDSHLAASLRGKAIAYNEGADLVEAYERRGSIRPRRRRMKLGLRRGRRIMIENS